MGNYKYTQQLLIVRSTGKRSAQKPLARRGLSEAIRVVEGKARNLRIASATSYTGIYKTSWYAQALWLEQFRLRNQAEMIARLFGEKKR